MGSPIVTLKHFVKSSLCEVTSAVAWLAKSRQKASLVVISHFMHRAGQRCFELLAPIGSPQLLLQSYSPAGQDSWPNWTNLKGLHSGRAFVGNKRFFTCGT